jgi:hypothetical protein
MSYEALQFLYAIVELESVPLCSLFVGIIFIVHLFSLRHLEADYIFCCFKDVWSRELFFICVN